MTYSLLEIHSEDTEKKKKLAVNLFKLFAIAFAILMVLMHIKWWTVNNLH
jgi:hypothetical protein